MNEKERKKIEQKQNKLLFTFSAANLDTTWGWGGGENRGVRRGGGGGGEEGSKGAFTHRSEQSGALLRRLVD